MARFSYVEVWPPTGHPDRPWGEDDVQDALAKSARSVTELYSEALATLGVANRCSMLRLGCSTLASGEDVRVSVVTEQPEGMEMGRVAVPASYAALPPKERAEVALDAVHGAVLRLAEARGWDGSVFEACRQHVLLHDLVQRWDGPWKSAPDRRHRARARFRLTPDGYGRAHVEVQRRCDEAVVATSDEAVAFSTTVGFRRGAATLRWEGSATVSLAPYAGFSVPPTPGSIRVGRDGSAWGSTVRDDVTVRAVPAGAAATARPRVVVVGTGIDAPEQRPGIRIIGGGPMNGVPHAYDEALGTLLAELAGEEGQRWWLGARIRELCVTYRFETRSAQVRGRLVGQRLSVGIDRPTATMVSDPEGTAAEDVERLVAWVRRRTGLGPHPTLPG